MNRELDQIREADSKLAETLEDCCGWSSRDPPQTEQPYIESCQLFGCRDCLLIRHDGEFYCLRRTKRNRLILTK